MPASSFQNKLFLQEFVHAALGATHKINGLTESDFSLAAKIDALQS